ncbi:hypothetical protein DB30_03679 [Enhygromyxa salina]|uniref:Uncharacterized protein n=1 Tax=Enhygromyxa salina TaxID=215803 RepID=A0A0C2DBA1_9BACT|nr:hypothetical protein [Enhygromyxa salina]KIG17082.1 hypothetical protein DB30_03679 [Enhygromyxa salina]
MSALRTKLERVALVAGIGMGVTLLGVGIWLVTWIFPIGTGAAASRACAGGAPTGRA